MRTRCLLILLFIVEAISAAAQLLRQAAQDLLSVPSDFGTMLVSISRWRLYFAFGFTGGLPKKLQIHFFCRSYHSIRTPEVYGRLRRQPRQHRLSFVNGRTCWLSAPPQSSCPVFRRRRLRSTPREGKPVTWGFLGISRVRIPLSLSLPTITREFVG